MFYTLSANFTLRSAGKPGYNPKQFAQTLIDSLNSGNLISPYEDPTGLTSGRAVLKRLEEFMDSWVAAGLRLERWAHRRTLGGATLTLMQHPDGRVYLRAEWRHDVDPDIILAALVRPQGQKASAAEVTAVVSRQVASEVFRLFLTSEFSGRVGRCDRCGKFWLNASNRPGKKFCSARCSTVVAVAKAIQRRRTKKRLEKLSAVRAAFDSWHNLSAKQQSKIRKPKAWLAAKAGVTLTFITRGINCGELPRL